MSSSSSLWLMAMYAIIALGLQAMTVAVIYVLESSLGAWSGAIFVTVYFSMFWLAWPIAVRLTEPKEVAAASAQKA